MNDLAAYVVGRLYAIDPLQSLDCKCIVFWIPGCRSGGGLLDSVGVILEADAVIHVL